MLIDRSLPQLEQAAWRIARQWFGDRVRGRELQAAILELSSLYNAPRAPRPELASLRDERSLLARLLFFTLADLPKAALAFAELLGLGALPPGNSQRLAVLDVGAGCGAMALGLATLCDGLAGRAGAPTGLEVTALDSDDDALGIALQLATESRLPIQLEARHHDLEKCLRIGDRRYPLIVAGSLLNELDPGRQLPLARELLARLAPGGALILIEPALREHSRSLHALRDRLLETAGVAVLAPCTRRGPCPALANPADWCHENRVWAPPPELRALATASGLRRRDLAYSYLTLRLGGELPRSRRPGAWRVVSAPLRSKGKHELFLCGEPGRLRATLLARHRSQGNASFLRAERGGLLWLEGDLSETGPAALRLGAGTKVELVDPAALAFDEIG